jgi:MFS transporter, Spinster family, sphingosine-1-phosphate transporter
VVIDVIHPSLRATGASVLSLMRNLFGLAGGPLLTGVLSDTYGLQFAMSVVPLFGLAAAVLYVVAARTYPADLKHIERAVPAVDGALTPQAA